MVMGVVRASVRAALDKAAGKAAEERLAAQQAAAAAAAANVIKSLPAQMREKVTQLHAVFPAATEQEVARDCTSRLCRRSSRTRLRPVG